MTARDHFSDENPAPHGDTSASAAALIEIERTFRAAIGGRCATRILADWSQQVGLGETEFEVLWLLRSVVVDGHDQTTLARQLAFSPAQISATVERLRARGCVEQQALPGDRRRHLWRLTDAGQALLQQLLQQAGATGSQKNGGIPREAAA